MMKILIILSLSLNPMLLAHAEGTEGAKTMSYAQQLDQASMSSCVGAMKMQAAIGKCSAAAKNANTWCMAESSPKIHMGVVAVGGLLAGISMMKSMQDSCNKFNDAMKVGQLALTAYNTSCSIVQTQCDTACTALSAEIKAAIEEGATAAAGNVQAGLEASCAKAVEASTTGVVGTCKGYTTSMMVAGAGIMSMLQQSGLMGKCEKAVAAVDCAKDPTNKECPQAMDCTNAANAGNAVCICKVNPSAPGCGGAMANNNNNAPVGNAGRPTAADLGAGDIGNYTPTGSSDGLISPTGGSAAGGASLGGGAGSGGGGGGAGGGSGSAKEKDAAKKAGLNANILGGYEGGGGGGGSRGGGGSGNSGLKDFLPGGARDPNRNIAAQGLVNREVTASGSKSNWEKVSDRYRDNQRSLMGP